jgi:hypothetical protein
MRLYCKVDASQASQGRGQFLEAWPVLEWGREMGVAWHVTRDGGLCNQTG